MRYVLLAAALLAWPHAKALAGGPCSGVRGGCGRSEYRASYSSGYYVPSQEKTVHVSGYTRKDGTYVAAYNRRPPGTATEYRSGYRSGYWEGTGSAPTPADESPELLAPPPKPITPYVSAGAKRAHVLAHIWRTWTSRDGRFHVFARLLKLEGESVFLERKDSIVLDVPMAKLSSEDIAYLDSIWTVSRE